MTQLLGLPQNLRPDPHGLGIIATEVSSKRRQGFPSETHVKRRDRVVGGRKELIEELHFVRRTYRVVQPPIRRLASQEKSPDLTYRVLL